MEEGEEALKATLVECIMGIFGFDEAGKIIDKTLFPKDPEKIAEILGKIQLGEVVKEVSDLIEGLKEKGFNEFVLESESLSRAVYKKHGVEVKVESPSEAGEILRRNLGKIAFEIGYFEKPEEVRDLTHEVSVILSKVGVRRAAEKRDLLVAQAIQAMDDIDKTLNLFSNRLREWYGLHFPELNNLVDKHDTYLRLVADLGDRSHFKIENLEKEGLPKEKAQIILKNAETSMGASIGEEDLEEIRSLCQATLELYTIRDKFEKYIDETMKEVAPNLRELVGSTLGARLIATVGGIQNLAKKPASTIQVLGAEKALFRSLRSGARPPKHGLIFQHQAIHQAPRWQRGKIARALAGKSAIAARVDAFDGEYVAEKLKADLEKRIAEIKEKYEKPPGRVKPRRLMRGHKR